ncbi:hypothetical protein ACIRPX_05740 [Streptomyces sp. NPDC101225]|uniref:hypothetical protein n=1 Tax=Streptomyces sp. NPDC101225 TaxID=3366135 RepID=UPI003830EC8F
MRALKTWRGAVSLVFLCALAVPTVFAARDVHRFVAGDPAKTLGQVHCTQLGSCTGRWRLPGGRRGAGEIEGLSFAYDEELVTDVPLYAGSHWAVKKRSSLMVHAARDVLVTAGGTVLLLLVAAPTRK